MESINLLGNIHKCFNQKVVELKIFRILTVAVAIILTPLLYNKMCYNGGNNFKWSNFFCLLFILYTFLFILFIQTSLMLKVNIKRIVVSIEVSDFECTLTSINGEKTILQNKVRIYKEKWTFKASLVDFYNKTGILPSPFTKDNSDSYFIEADKKLLIFPKLFESPQRIYDIINKYAIDKIKTPE